MRRTIAAGLVVLAGLAGAASAWAAPLAAKPIGRMELPWWRARLVDKQHEIDAGGYDLVYYGDSITQNFERAGKVAGSDWPAVWAKYYAPRHALNLGFKGDTTASLLWRLGMGEGKVRGFSGAAPKVAIVLIGANNMGRVHWPAADTVAGIEADVAAIRVALPKTRIVLLGVLPSIRSAWVDEQTRLVNAALAREYAAGGVVVFRDVGAVLMREGKVDAGAFVDPLLTPPDPPLHPSEAGAGRIAAAIEPLVASAMGDRRP